MDNRRERKTSGESAASDSSETASCRPYYLPETPADLSSSQVVRSATPSTYYAPNRASTSLSRVDSDYSQSPSELMDFHRSNQPCSSHTYNPLPRLPLSMTVPTQSSSVSNLTPLSFQQMPSDQMNHSCYNWTTGGMERCHERQLPVRVQETASHRPYHMPETPAAFSSQVVRSTAPSTWYAPCSSSTSRVGDYSQSPSDSVDFHWSNQPCSSYNPSPRFSLPVTFPTQSGSFCNSTLSNKSGEEKRRLSPSWSTADPKQLTHVDKTGFQQILSESLLLQMDNRRERKTSGESTASDSSETASCRPYYLPQTPADFSSSQVVRSATPSTWYAPYRASTSRVGDYSQSPSDVMDFHKSNEPFSSDNPSPRRLLSITVPTQSNSVSNSTPLNESGKQKRWPSPSWSTPDPKQFKHKTVSDSEQDENSGMQDCYDNPPRLSFKVPKLSDLRRTYCEWNNVELPVDFLVLTVEDCEFVGFFSYLENPSKSYTRDIGPVYFGFMGNDSGNKLKVALMKSSKGSAVPGGSLTVVKDAVRVLRPKAVFLVGACSGLNHARVKLGDVVVSSKLTTTVFKTPASRDIGNLIRHAADGWEAPLENPDAWEVRVHCDGNMLSRPEGVGEDIIQRNPGAIAVEMEGEGVFAAAHDLKTEWVVVKGIRSYADSSQLAKDEWGVFASVMAASVVANILSDPIVFKEWPNYQVTDSEASAEDIFDVKFCGSKLADHYKKTATVPTSVWSKNCVVDIHQIYTRLSWVKEEQTPAGSSRSELKHYTDVFTANKNGVVPKRILVQGQTGIGKSTFVKKLVVDWAELDDTTTGDKQKDILKTFQLLVAVNLKEVSKCQSLKDVISHSSIFAREEKYLTDSLLNYITNNQDKVLLVFDGYDEYRCGSNSEIYEIFSGNELRNCCVLITTRISKADELRAFKDLHAEITGFGEEDREAFMSRMLGSEEEAQELGFHLFFQNLYHLAKVPLLLLFFCTLWKKGKSESFPESKTKLYLAIVQYVLDHNQRKDSPARFGKVHDFKEVIAEIGKVALECLLRDDHVFEYDQLSDAVVCDESFIVGLLQVTEYAENLRPAGLVSFIHKSIQEFLAAWFVTYRCVPEGNLGGIEQHARTLEDCRAWENVLQFVCGLSDDGAVKVFQHLTSVRISDPTLDLSKTIPDEENEEDVPLCEVTDRHERFSDLVDGSFKEVQSKAALVRDWLDCTAGIILITPAGFDICSTDLVATGLVTFKIY